MVSGFSGCFWLGMAPLESRPFVDCENSVEGAMQLNSSYLSKQSWPHDFSNSGIASRCISALAGVAPAHACSASFYVRPNKPRNSKGALHSQVMRHTASSSQALKALLGNVIPPASGMNRHLTWNLHNCYLKYIINSIICFISII